MATHNINITVNNAIAGSPASSDGVMMIFIKGYAIAGKLALGTPYLLSQLSDAEDLGLSDAYDENNSVAVYQQVSEYYNGGLNDGALLWLVVVPVNTAYADYVTTDPFQALVRYTGTADQANRAKMIGFCYDVPTAVQIVADFPADVTNSILAIQNAQESLFQQGYQWSAILDGYNMNPDTSPVNLVTNATRQQYSVSLCITGTRPNGVSGVGLALGRFARISVGHGFGAVADGPVSTNTAYLTNGVEVGENIISGTGGVLQVGRTYVVLEAPIIYNGVTYQVGSTFVAVTGHTSFTTSNGGYVVTGSTPVGMLSPASITALGSKQYLFLTTQFGVSGFYWNDGATCVAANTFLSSQEYNRVANKLSADCLAFFTLFKGQNLPTDLTTGDLAQSWIAAQQGAFDQQYVVPLVNGGDIVDAQLTIKGPNFNANAELDFTLTIVRSTILGNVVGEIKFSTTL